MSKTWNNHLSAQVIILTVCHTILTMLVWRIWYGSTNHHLIDIYLCSYHSPACYCIDVVQRNSVMVAHGSKSLVCYIM